MANRSKVPADILERYRVQEWRNGITILSVVHKQEWQDIVETLRDFRLLASEIKKPGGRKTEGIVGRIDGALYKRAWKEKSFDTRIIVDDIEHPSPTHAVDCFKNRVALEMEWNSKDTTFDRDLNNFRLLFDLRVIDVGVIVTRATELHSTIRKLRKKTSYGESTTHFDKLLPRIEGGGGGGCPIVAFAIKKECYIDDSQ
ncbi:MAG: restriction endonuclease [Alphaproteobacteria bacterium]|nr:restriction endonuclease [Alphaproteobacteria bacterium]